MFEIILNTSLSSYIYDQQIIEKNEFIATNPDLTF